MLGYKQNKCSPVDFVPRTAPRPELQPDSLAVESVLRQAVRWVLGVRAAVEIAPRPPTPRIRAEASGKRSACPAQEPFESTDFGDNLAFSSLAGRGML